MVIVKQVRVDNIVVNMMISRTGKIFEGNVIYFRSSESQNIF